MMQKPFDALTYDQWLELAHRETKGADPATLAWQLEGEISVPAYHTHEQRERWAYLDALHTYAPPAGWVYREEIEVENVATARAHTDEALTGGAEALSYAFGADVELPRLLAGRNLRNTLVTYRTDAVGGLLRYLRQYHPSLSAVKGTVHFDPLTGWLTRGADPDDDWTGPRAQLIELFKTFDTAVRFFPVTVGLDHYADAGATAPQQLAWGLAQALQYVEWLTAAGVPANECFRRVEFSVSVGSSYLVEVAKLRALRWLWLKMAEAWGVPAGEVRWSAHARTARWSYGRRDPYANLLRHTTQAMAAVLGGATALTIDPHVVEAPDGGVTARRLARNVSTLMREEAYLARVADPLAGAYSVEFITDALVRRTWDRLRQVQAAGGWRTVAESGVLLDDLARARQARMEALQRREKTMVGINTPADAQKGEGGTPPAARWPDAWPAPTAEQMAALKS
ncbi:MAG: methylmalonyl-CoA mutase family protein [Catalinimonas sp.]